MVVFKLSIKNENKVQKIMSFYRNSLFIKYYFENIDFGSLVEFGGS